MYETLWLLSIFHLYTVAIHHYIFHQFLQVQQGIRVLELERVASSDSHTKKY